MFASHGFFRKVVGGYAKAKLYTKIDWKYRKLWHRRDGKDISSMTIKEDPRMRWWPATGRALPFWGHHLRRFCWGHSVQWNWWVPDACESLGLFEETGNQHGLWSQINDKYIDRQTNKTTSSKGKKTLCRKGKLKYSTGTNCLPKQ